MSSTPSPSPSPSSSTSSQPTLKRNLTLFSVICIGLNGVIGQGIFLVPGKAAGLMGPSALLALAIGALLCFCIALCFAEVGSRIHGTGGAYLYAKEAFGDFIGFEVGWMTCLISLISWATLANGFTRFFLEIVPLGDGWWLKKGIAFTLVTALSFLNLRGVQSSARVVQFFTITKLVPLFLFICVGLFSIQGKAFLDFAPHGMTPLAETTLLLLYAYVGFEVLVVPAGEMKNPKKNVPLALFCVLGLCTVVYMAVFGVAVGTLASIANHPNAVSASAQTFLGGGLGIWLIPVGIALSALGSNTGSGLVSPRRLYAMAEQGDFPAFLKTIHPKTGVPHYSVIGAWLGTILLLFSGTVEQLIVIGVLARFSQYIPTILAVLVLRKRSDFDPQQGYVVPGGWIIPIFTLLLCAWLLWNQKPMSLLIGGLALLAGVPFYFFRTYSADQSKSASDSL